MRMPSGVTDQVIYFVAVDSTDLVTRKTGLSSFTVYRSRNGGTATAYTTPTVTELSSSNMPGVYKLLLDEDMTIDAGDDSQEVCLHVTATGMAPVTRTFELYRPKITAGDTLTTSSGVIPTVTAVTTVTNLTNAPTAGDLTATMKTSILGTALTEAYRADGSTGTLAQLLYEIVAHLGESSIASTTKTIKKIDGSTTAATFTLNDATTPTSITRTT